MGIGPVIEPPSSESLLTSYSFETLSSGNSHKIPMIIGFNNNEASAADKFPYSSKSFLYNTMYNFFLEFLSVLLKLWGLSYQNFMSNVVPIDMNIFSLAKRVAARLKITEKYFGLIPSIGQTFPKFLKVKVSTIFEIHKKNLPFLVRQRNNVHQTYSKSSTTTIKDLQCFPISILIFE